MDLLNSENWYRKPGMNPLYVHPDTVTAALKECDLVIISIGYRAHNRLPSASLFTGYEYILGNHDVQINFRDKCKPEDKSFIVLQTVGLKLDLRKRKGCKALLAALDQLIRTGKNIGYDAVENRDPAWNLRTQTEVTK